MNHRITLAILLPYDNPTRLVLNWCVCFALVIHGVRNVEVAMNSNSLEDF